MNSRSRSRRASARTAPSRPIRSTTIYGGVGFDPQVRALRAGPEIVVATPGRLLDHLSQRTIDLSRVEILVLDEADRMLDMGFIRDIRKVLAVLPAKRQNLLFSATFSDEIRRLADGFLDRPASVQVTPRNTATELVTQVVHPVDRERKRELLSYLITSGRIDQALVFTRTKHGANRLALQLEKDGIKATAIHGNKSQPQRVRALADFKAGRYAVLVATEIAARGLDIDALPHVVNFELPMVPEDYVHRIGRTGRAEKDGDAVSLVCVDEMKLLGEIEKVLGRRIPTEVIAGFEPDPRIRPEPILRGGLGTTRPQSAVRATAAAPTPLDRAARPAPTTVRTGGAGLRSRGGGYAPPRRPGQGLGNGAGVPARVVRPRADPSMPDARPRVVDRPRLPPARDRVVGDRPSDRRRAMADRTRPMATRPSVVRVQVRSCRASASLARAAAPRAESRRIRRAALSAGPFDLARWQTRPSRRSGRCPCHACGRPSRRLGPPSRQHARRPWRPCPACRPWRLR